MPDSESDKLKDAQKLAIRDEVEHLFLNPPANLTKGIEDEVKERVAEKERFYRWIGLIVLGALTTIAFIWYHATLSTVGEKVTQALAEKKVTEARDRIMAIDADVQARSLRVSNLTQSVEESGKVIIDRLAQIKKQDNVVLIEDLPNLFASEIVTNFSGGKITLAHNPVEQTIKIYYEWTILPRAKEYFYNIDGRVLTFTNNDFISQLPRLTDGNALTVQYIRNDRLN